MVSIPFEIKLFEDKISEQVRVDQLAKKEGYKSLAIQESGINTSEERRKQAAQAASTAQSLSLRENSSIPGWQEFHNEALQAAKNRLALQSQIPPKSKAAKTAYDQSWRASYTDNRGEFHQKDYHEVGSIAYKRSQKLLGEIRVLNKQIAASDAAEQKANAEAQKLANDFRSRQLQNAGVALKKAEAFDSISQIQQKALDKKTGDFAEAVEKRGFIGDFESMENAAWAKDGGSLLFFLWFIRFLFFTIEILPTIVKLATPLGEYDRQLHAHEQMFARALTTNYRILQEREQLRQETELSIAQQLEQLRAEKEVELGQNVLTETARRQNELAQQMLKKWYAQEKAKLTPAPAPAPARNGQAVVTAPPTVGPAPASLPSTAPAAPVASPATLAPVAGANGATAPPTSIASPSVVLPAASQASASLLKSVPSAARQPSLTGKNWQREDDLAKEVYHFFNGSAAENFVERTRGNERPVSGKWSFIDGDESALSVKFNGEENGEYIVSLLTNYQLHLADSVTNRLLKFKSE